MQISTIELERLFYSGAENLEMVRDALQEEFEQVETGDDILISYITDNTYQADKLLNERTALYSKLVRALEIADAALDFYENKFLEEIRLEAEKNEDPKVKKPTDSVMKAQAAIRASIYRRFRNIIRGYVSGCERSLASLRSSLQKCQSEAYLASKASYRQPEPQNENNNE